MSAGGGSGDVHGGGIDGDPQQQQQQHEHQRQPVDVENIEQLLAECGVTKYEPGVMDALLEFMYAYTVDVLERAQRLSNHAAVAGRKASGASGSAIDVEDIRLAAQLVDDVEHRRGPVTRTVDMRRWEAAVNGQCAASDVVPGQALHGTDPGGGNGQQSKKDWRLPPDNYCTLNPTYQLKRRQQQGQQQQESARGAAQQEQPRSNVQQTPVMTSVTRKH